MGSTPCISRSIVGALERRTMSTALKLDAIGREHRCHARDADQVTVRRVFNEKQRDDPGRRADSPANPSAMANNNHK